MARDKKKREAFEATDENLEAMDENAEESLEPDEDLDASTDDDSATDESSEKPKRRRSSSSRKRKDADSVTGRLLASASRPRRSKSEENTVTEVPAAVETEPEAPKAETKARAKKDAKEEKAPKTEVRPKPAPDLTDLLAAAAVAAEPTPVAGEAALSVGLDVSRPDEDRTVLVTEAAPPAEAAGKPWAAMKDVSQGLVQNLERITQSMQELPTKYSGALNDLLKTRKPRPALVTKIAFGLSAASLVLSLISLSLAQSARQQALTVRSTPATTTVAGERRSRRAERVEVARPANDEITRLAKEIARSSTAPLAAAGATAAHATPPGEPEATRVEPKSPEAVRVPEPRREERRAERTERPAVKPVSEKPAPKPTVKPVRPRRVTKPVAARTEVRRPRATPAPASTGGLQPDAARVKALNDLAKTPSRSRGASPSLFE